MAALLVGAGVDPLPEGDVLEGEGKEIVRLGVIKLQNCRARLSALDS